jgi:predicted glycogen debranching enzyme
MAGPFTSGWLRDFSNSGRLEWLETNGLGGYASSTISGANSRRYHGLLVAAVHPPVGRMVVLSKLEETIVIADERFEMSANRYPGVIHPRGYEFLESFQRDLFPEFIFHIGNVRLKKTMAAVHGENTTLIQYEVLEGPDTFRLELFPLCSARDFHHTTQKNDALYTGYVFEDGIFRTKNYADSPELFISVPGSAFEETKNWYNHFEFTEEQNRRLDFSEDLFNHGKFVVELKKGDKLGVTVSTEYPEGDFFQKLESERNRRLATIDKFPESNIRRLVLAADQFIVKREADLKTIIAGYHWFSDWGRDTMIALPGLCLVTGRFGDARKILRAFAGYVSEGMLPNRFPDHNEKPEYNTADATLWFFYALNKYNQYTQDKAFVSELIPVLKDIIDWHVKGTRYHIHVDHDELLYAGEEGVQLTWMDARVGDWVVTPRKGKAVEVNALWINALAVITAFLKERGDEASAVYARKMARAVKSFNALFWNEEKGYLFDFVDGKTKNDDLRPNQLFALSLPVSLLSPEQEVRVFEVITKKLLTPAGLRSLSFDHPDYQGHYDGDPWHRDAAYHQGTVWSYLLGPYLDALVRLKGEKGLVKAKKIISTFMEHLDDAGVGTVSEIFDGDKPNAPKGCIAQAWGVAEILRVALEYKLFDPKGKVPAQ